MYSGVVDKDLRADSPFEDVRYPLQNDMPVITITMRTKCKGLQHKSLVVK